MMIYYKLETIKNNIRIIMEIIVIYYKNVEIIILQINPLASLSEGAPALKYGDVNTLTPSPGEVKELKSLILLIKLNYIIK